MGCCTSSVWGYFSARSRRNQMVGLNCSRPLGIIPFLRKPRDPVNKPCPSRKNGTTLRDDSPASSLILIFNLGWWGNHYVVITELLSQNSSLLEVSSILADCLLWSNCKAGRCLSVRPRRKRMWHKVEV